MKKIISILVICLVSTSLMAQNRISYSVEVDAGVGVGKGPQFTVAPEFVVKYEFESGILLGAGAGLRYGKPCFQYRISNASGSRQFCNELDIPVFLRAGYSFEHLFSVLDAGYSVGVWSAYSADTKPGGSKAPSYNGFFLEPQAGFYLGKHSALALGVLFQQSSVIHQETVVSGNVGSASYSIQAEAQTKNIFTPALTIRYGFVF